MSKRAHVKLNFELIVEVDEEDFDGDDPRQWALITANEFRKHAVIRFQDEGELIDEYQPTKVDVRLAKIFEHKGHSE